MKKQISLACYGLALAAITLAVVRLSAQSFAATRHPNIVIRWPLPSGLPKSSTT